MSTIGSHYTPTAGPEEVYDMISVRRLKKRGAWGGAIIKALLRFKCEVIPGYRCIVGTLVLENIGVGIGCRWWLSTPLSLEKTLRLRSGFTDVTQDAIFNINPFKADGSINSA